MAVRRYHAFFPVLALPEQQDETPGFADDMAWDFISNVIA